jgi:serine/threonine protein kinase
MAGVVEFHRKQWKSLSEEAYDFVKRLLAIDPRLRMTADQAVAHPWLRAKVRPPALRLAPGMKHKELNRKAGEPHSAITKTPSIMGMSPHTPLTAHPLKKQSVSKVHAEPIHEDEERKLDGTFKGESLKASGKYRSSSTSKSKSPAKKTSGPTIRGSGKVQNPNLR